MLLVYLFVCFDVSCLKVFPCSLSLCFVIPFSNVITSLGEEGAGLFASRALIVVCFVRVRFFHFFLFLFASGVGCSL